MARPTNEFTDAVRTLLAKTKGNLTHMEARPELKRMGIPIAHDNDADAMKAESNSFNSTKYQWKNNAGLIKSRRPATTKNSPKAKAQKASKSKRVVEAPPRKYTHATTTNGKRKKNAPVVTELTISTDEALSVIRGEGGMAATQAKIEQLRQQAAELEAACFQVTTFQEEVARAS